MAQVWARCVMLMMMFVANHVSLTGAKTRVGVNYGMLGDNLPSPTQAVDLMKRSNIRRVRLFEPNHEVLEALRGSYIEVVIGTSNQDLITLANDPMGADNWITTNIAPFRDVRFLLITAGNEVIPGPNALYVLPAMKNLQASLYKAGLGKIKVTTAVHTKILGMSYPPSQGVFQANLTQLLTDIVKYLDTRGFPLMINVYPYHAFSRDPENIALEYALFQKTTPAFNDQGRDYYNLFDATVDAYRAALMKALGNDNLKIIIGETGWPSAGNPPLTSIENARIYNNNLKKHVLTKGTPAKPEQLLDVYIFALFNENKKQAGIEQNFGSFYPNMKPVYHLW